MKHRMIMVLSNAQRRRQPVKKRLTSGRAAPARIIGGSGVLVKVHTSHDRSVISACDKTLLGKTLRQGKLVITVSKHFYGGEERPDEDVIEILRHAPNANIIGKKAIALALRAGLIVQENVSTIKGVPHAQSYTIEY